MTSFLSQFISGGSFASLQNDVSDSVLTARLAPINGPTRSMPRLMYRVSVYMRTRTPGNGNLTASVAFTDEIGPKIVPLPGVLALDANAFATSVVLIEVDSGEVTLTANLAGTGSYDIKAVVEPVGG